MKTITPLTLFVILGFLVSSCAVNHKREERGLSNLRATLSGASSTDELSNYNLTVTLKNVGNEPAFVNTDLMHSPTYIATYNARGERLYVLPPSAYLTPSFYYRHTWRKISPGEEYSLSYLMTSLSETTPAGRYVMKASHVQSNSLMVRVISE